MERSRWKNCELGEVGCNVWFSSRLLSLGSTVNGWRPSCCWSSLWWECHNSSAILFTASLRHTSQARKRPTRKATVGQHPRTKCSRRRCVTLLNSHWILRTIPFLWMELMKWYDASLIWKTYACFDCEWSGTCVDSALRKSVGLQSSIDTPFFYVFFFCLFRDSSSCLRILDLTNFCKDVQKTWHVYIHLKSNIVRSTIHWIPTETFKLSSMQIRTRTFPQTYVRYEKWCVNQSSLLFVNVYCFEG